MANSWQVSFLLLLIPLSQRLLASGESIDVNAMKQGWVKIQHELAYASGRFNFAINYSGAKSPPDQSFQFQINGELAKRIEPVSKNGEEIVTLWTKEGSYVLRKPPGEKWMIAKSSRVGDWQGESPIRACSRSIAILSAPLLFLINSKDFKITKLEREDDGHVILDIEYLKKFSEFELSKIDPNTSEKPTFDRVSIRLDADNNFRILNYRLTRTLASGATERVKVEYSYGNSETPFLPSAQELVFLAADEKQVLTKFITTFSDTSRERVPESEFTLEHYGLSTPDTVSTSWSTVISSILGAFVFLVLAVRFFRRQ
jgi:hypothetical protein